MTDTSDCRAVAVYDKPLSKPPQTVANARALIMANQAQLAGHIAKASGVSIDEVVSSAISAIATADPKAQMALLACTGTSILKAVADSARYGLTIGTVMGQAYLVPFKNQCRLIVGYRGLESLAYRSGRVRCMQSGTVYADDAYDVQIGRQPDPVRHTPMVGASHKTNNIVAAYAVAWLEQGLALAESLTREDLDLVRATSKMPDSPAYRGHLAEMFRKAAIRRLCKHLPLSPTDRTLMDEMLSAEDGQDAIPGGPAREVVAEGEARAAELRSMLGGEDAEETAQSAPGSTPAAEGAGSQAEAPAATGAPAASAGPPDWPAEPPTGIRDLQKQIEAMCRFIGAANDVEWEVVYETAFRDATGKKPVALNILIVKDMAVAVWKHLRPECGRWPRGT